MGAFVSHGLPLPGGIEAILPARQPSDLDQDVITHKRDDRFSQAAFTVMDGGTADAELPGHSRSGRALDQALDDGPIPG